MGEFSYHSRRNIYQFFLCRVNSEWEVFKIYPLGFLSKPNLGWRVKSSSKLPLGETEATISGWGTERF